LADRPRTPLVGPSAGMPQTTPPLDPTVDEERQASSSQSPSVVVAEVLGDLQARSPEQTVDQETRQPTVTETQLPKPVHLQDSSSSNAQSEPSVQPEKTTAATSAAPSAKVHLVRSADFTNSLLASF
jgi:hypothetical protein